MRPIVFVSVLAATVSIAHSQFIQQGSKLVGTNATASASQGSSVSLSSDGNTAIVGGLGDNGAAGAAWVFTRTAGGWSQQGYKLVGSGAVGSARQGYSVSLSADGNTAIISGPYDNSNAGAVWVFTRTGGTWGQQGSKLVGTGAVGSAVQGNSVSLSSDGNTAIVGGTSDNSSAGAAWIFVRAGNAWSQQGSKLVGTGAVGVAGQGFAVALSGDGNTAIVGGLNDNSNAGAAWIFTRTGGVWSQQGNRLVGTGAGPGYANQGHSVSLSSDGNTAIVGGWTDNAGAGAAWVFTRTGGVWSQQGSKLVGTGAVGSARQGYSVTLSADGNTAIISGPYDNSSAGAVWVFTRTGGTWSQQGSKLVGTGAVGSASQGQAVSLSADGNTAIVGGPSDSSYAGAAWVYTRVFPPSAPVATAATNVAQTSFTANWNTSTGATSYLLDVATDTSFASILSGYNNVDVGDVQLQTVTGLTARTKYFYRIRASNTGGTSASSNIISVTTVAVSPPAPVATAATSVTQTSFTANWNASTGATSYLLDVATDTNFTSILSSYNNVNVGDVQSQNITGLTAGTKYFYRVRANTASGTSGNSNIISVTTIVPPIAPTGLMATNITTTGFTALWNPVALATGYQLDVSEDDFLSLLPGYAQLSVGNTTRHIVSGLSPSTTYCFHVRAENTGGLSDTSAAAHVITYAGTYTIGQTTIPFTSAQSLTSLSSTNYRLIGIPGDSKEDIGQFLYPGQWKQDWQLYRDNGKEADYYEEYTQGDSVFICRPGRGFWLLCKESWTPSGVVTTSLLDTSAETAIALTSGRRWNLITNPFDRPLTWTAVLSRNNISSPLYTWQAQSGSTGWDYATQMVPLTGYLFPNDSARSVLYIPYDATFNGTSLKAGVQSGEWTIHVKVSSGALQDRTTYFGISPGATPGVDKNKMPKPRHFAEIPDVYFNHQEWNATYPEYATDIRSETKDVMEWNLNLRSGQRKQVSIDFVGVETVPGKLAVFLIDEGLGGYKDLRESSHYVKVTEKPVTALKVLVGDPDAVFAKAVQCVPNEFALLQNYPNPFNPSTTIAVRIPGQCVLALEIFNILGQRVKVLYRAEIGAGNHYFDWDGRDEIGNTAASGSYIYRMSVAGQSTFSRRMLLLK